MKRRTLLTVGLTTATLLTLAGAGWVMVRPARTNGQLSPPARAMFSAVARAILGPLLPNEPGAREAQLQGHLARLNGTIQAMPPAVQGEIDELVSILVSPPGRWALLDLRVDWEQASAADVEASLTQLRRSTLGIRQQVYGALRELTNAAYFADPAAWTAMGYNGQRALSDMAAPA